MRPEAKALYLLTEIHSSEQNAHVYGPNYATPHAAGMDLRACICQEQQDLAPQDRVLIPTGIAIEPLQEHVAGFVYSRSGLGAKDGLVVAQGVGVIDNDYRGEIMVMIVNTSSQMRSIHKGQRIAQIVFQPVVRMELDICESLGESVRGGGGFGHTGY